MTLGPGTGGTANCGVIHFGPLPQSIPTPTFHSCAEPQTFPDVPSLLQGLRLNGALPQVRAANQLILVVASKPRLCPLVGSQC